MDAYIKIDEKTRDFLLRCVVDHYGMQPLRSTGRSNMGRLR